MRKLKTLLVIGGLAMGGMTVLAVDKEPPALPNGVTPKALNDMKDERNVLAKLTNYALTKGDFKDVIGLLTTPDVNRMNKFADQDFAELDGRIAQINQNWKVKYGHDFKMTQDAVDGMTVISEGEISDADAIKSSWPVEAAKSDQANAANTADTVKYLDKGREVAVLRVLPNDNLPAVNVSMLHEAIDDWRVDVPDDFTGQKVYDNLKDALTSIGDNVASWPANEQDAYHYVSQRVIMAVYGVPAPAMKNAPHAGVMGNK